MFYVKILLQPKVHIFQCVFVYTAVHSSTSFSGSDPQSDVIQTVCQIYETAEGERVHPRKTMVVRANSPLHPFTVCCPLYPVHQGCEQIKLEFLPSHLVPPTMAHHYYFLRIRDTQLRDSLKDELYRQIYHTPPNSLEEKYSSLRAAFGLPSPNDYRMLMFSVLKHWSTSCMQIKKCLKDAKLLPIRLEYVDGVFEGSLKKKKESSESHSYDEAREVDEYGWAVEMVRAVKAGVILENSSTVYVGDETSIRILNYLEWGRRLNEREGQLQNASESMLALKYHDIGRMPDIIRALHKVHFGNACVTIIIAAGARELEEPISAAKYRALLKEMLDYLLQFEIRIIVVPPTPVVNKTQLWLEYTVQQYELSSEYASVEFLIIPSLVPPNRSFLDSLLVGKRKLDLSVCDESGFTRNGIRKLSFYLAEVVQIPIENVLSKGGAKKVPSPKPLLDLELERVFEMNRIPPSTEYANNGYWNVANSRPVPEYNSVDYMNFPSTSNQSTYKPSGAIRSHQPAPPLAEFSVFPRPPSAMPLTNYPPSPYGDFSRANEKFKNRRKNQLTPSTERRLRRKRARERALGAAS